MLFRPNAIYWCILAVDTCTPSRDNGENTAYAEPLAMVEDLSCFEESYTFRKGKRNFMFGGENT
jgi:hypothetical protein